MGRLLEHEAEEHWPELDPDADPVEVMPSVYMVPEEDWTSRIKSPIDCLTDLLDATEARMERNELLHRMPYSEYLASPEWKEIRRLAVKRRQWTCERCGRRARSHDLNVHHLTYDRRGYEDLEDLLVLCEPCHAKEHGKAPR